MVKKEIIDYSKIECPCPGPIELIRYFERKRWENQKQYRPILIHHGTRSSMNVVWRIWCLEQDQKIERAREIAIQDKIKKVRKKEYLKELSLVLERMRKLSEMLDLERGILNSITKK